MDQRKIGFLSEGTSERKKSYPGTACGKNECVRENRIQMGDGTQYAGYQSAGGACRVL